MVVKNRFSSSHFLQPPSDEEAARSTLHKYVHSPSGIDREVQRDIIKSDVLTRDVYMLPTHAIIAGRAVERGHRSARFSHRKESADNLVGMVSG